MNPHELKQLLVRITKKKADVEAKLIASKESAREYSIADSELRKLEDEYKKELEGQKEIIITEHAYLRYFERVLGYDLDEVRGDILEHRVEQMINNLKTGKFPHREKFRLVVKNRVIVTIET